MNSSKIVGLMLKANAVTLLAMAPLAWLVGGFDATLAAIVGGLFGMGNIVVMSWSVKRLLTSAKAGAKPAYGLMIAAKFAVLVLLVWVAVSQLGLDAVGFVLGFSSMVLALLVAGFVVSTSPGIEENGSES